MTDLLNRTLARRRLRGHLARPPRGRPARPPGRGGAGPVRLAGRPRAAGPACCSRSSGSRSCSSPRSCPQVLAPGDPLAGVPADKLQAPSAAHWFGTDQLGRDLYTRVVHGTHLTLEAALVAVGVGLLVGALLGLLAGFVGGVSTTSSCASSTCCWPSRRCCCRSRSSPRSASAPSRSRSRSAWPASPPSPASCAPRCCACGVVYVEAAHAGGSRWWSGPVPARAAERGRPGGRARRAGARRRDPRGLRAELPRLRRPAARARVGRARLRRPRLPAAPRGG